MQTQESFALRSTDVDAFNEQGYLGPFTLCSPGEMNAIRARIDTEVLATQPTHNINEQSRHLDCRLVYDLCSHPAIVERMASIKGPNLVLWRSNFFTKMPGALEIPWHQDFDYWPIDPSINISAWLAIDESTVENSCVQIIPGSHKVKLPSVKSPPGMAFHKMADPAFYDASKSINMELKAGEFFLFNECTLHHSNPNRASKRRLGLAVRVTISSVKVNHDQLFPGHKVIHLCGEDTHHLNQVAQPPRA
jgi:ectoine hydroxylase-related dioxygenase (phytanoyl-CoA dioxygenase family)